MTQTSVFSQAHKAFRDTPRFRFVQSDPDVLSRYRELTRTVPSLGDAVGVYMNPGSLEPESILVAQGGLMIIGSGAPLRVPFAELESIRRSSKEDVASGIALVMRSGRVVNLRVGGGERRFEETVRLLGFLKRVLANQ